MRKVILLVRLVKSGAYRKADPVAMRMLVREVIIDPLTAAVYVWLMIGGIMLAIEVWRML